MVWMNLLGIFFVAAGTMFIVRRLLPLQVKDAGTHVQFIDAVLFRHRFITGALLALVGIGLIVIGERTITQPSALIELYTSDPLFYFADPLFHIVSMFLIIIGLISATFGLLFLLRPMIVIRLNTMVDMILGEDSVMMHWQILWGILILGVGLLLLYW